MLRQLFYLFLTLLNLNNHYNPVLPQKISPPESVEVTARVGGYFINQITGWTSPYAEVNLSGQNLVRKTLADGKGFFAFYSVPIVEGLKELCLIAQDINLLPSYPVCLALPENNNLEFRDILLPPTISVEGDKIPAGGTAKAAGMAYPDSAVDVYLFSDNYSFFYHYNLYKIYNFFFPKANAIGLPKYQVWSNENGLFEFSLPASAPSENRVFAVAQKKALGNSTKSNTLSFQTLGLLAILRLFLENFFRALLALRPKILWIILLEIAILLLLIILGKKKKKEKQNPYGQNKNTQ